MEFSLFSRWGPRRELINQCRCGVVCGDFLYWACGDRWRSRGNSTVTNIYIQKSSYFVARSLFISGVELLFSATAHPLAGENALLIPGQTAIVEQLLCGLWAPHTTAMCPSAVVCGSRCSWPSEPPGGAGFTGWLWDLLDLGQWELWRSTITCCC